MTELRTGNQAEGHAPEWVSFYTVHTPEAAKPQEHRLRAEPQVWEKLGFPKPCTA